jgi:substrate-binding protein of zinc uptake complex component A/ABC transporter family protein
VSLQTARGSRIGGARWRQALAPVKGAKVVVYHNDWPYLLARFGLAQGGTIEERPGIPPSPGHLARLIQQMKEDKVKVVVVDASFGVVVTSSVRIAGVLLVFSYLIAPALVGILLGGRLAARLLVRWAFGAFVSIVAMVASAVLDLPTGATVVCAFGVTLLALAIAARLTRRSVNALGPAALGAP